MRYMPLLSPRAGELQRAQWAGGTIVPSWPLASAPPCRVLLMFFPFIKNSQVVRVKCSLLPVLWPNPDTTGPKGVPCVWQHRPALQRKVLFRGNRTWSLGVSASHTESSCVTLEEVKLKEATTLLGVILEMNSSPILPKSIILWWRRSQQIENIKHLFYIALI